MRVFLSHFPLETHRIDCEYTKRRNLESQSNFSEPLDDELWLFLYFDPNKQKEIYKLNFKIDISSPWAKCFLEVR